MDEEKMLLEYKRELEAIADGDESSIPKYNTAHEYVRYLKDRIEYIERVLKAGRGFKR